MEPSTQLPHLFRTEYRKIVSVLCRTFGMSDVDTAEDIASETFLTAAQVWGIEGVPPNPTAWLYLVARYKAVNHFKRIATFKRHVSEGYHLQQAGDSYEPGAFGTEVSDAFFEDSQLRLMFALCHPAIPAEMQIALSLRLLCGFGISEIADAFITGKETITKRLQRAKERLREVNAPMEMPHPDQLPERLTSVLTAIYLLFNEGYYARGEEGIIRKDLCLEAVRLGTMIVEYQPTNLPETNALMALMCFHFSRFDSRLGDTGEVVLYDDQDTSSWSNEWLSRGGFFLPRAADGSKLTPFHLEAAIAYHHTTQVTDKWRLILALYDQLLLVKPSPIVAMNRAYAVFKVTGPLQAIAALEGVALNDSHLYHALLGELWSSEDRLKAQGHFERAIAITQSSPVRRALQKKLAALVTQN